MSITPEKLSAIVAKQRPFFASGPTTFQRAFPNVGRIELSIYQSGTRLLMESVEFGPDQYDETSAIPPVIDCENPECWSGGVRLDSLLREIVNGRSEQQEMDFEKTLFCPGHEGTRTKPYRKCSHRFVIKGHIVFQSSTSQSK